MLIVVRYVMSLKYIIFCREIFHLHGKNDLAKISKNLTRYRSENNFVGLSK